MVQSLIAKLGAVLLSVVLFLSTWGGFSQTAQADKTPTAVLFDPASEIVNVVTIYETTPETQKDAVSGIFKGSKSYYKKAPGFDSFSVLQSDDGARVMTLSQWSDLDSYEAAVAATATAAESTKSSKKKDDAIALEPARTLVFTVDQVLAPEGTAAALRGKDVLVQFSEITATAPEDFPSLLASAETLLPEAATLYPGPRSAVLLKGVGDETLAVLANWGYAMEYDDLSVVPTVAPLADDVATLAETDQHLYKMVKTIAAKPAKDEKD